MVKKTFLRPVVAMFLILIIVFSVSSFAEDNLTQEPDSAEIPDAVSETTEETSPEDVDPEETTQEEPEETGLEEITSYIKLPALMPSSSFSGTDFTQEENLKNVKNLVLRNEHGEIDFGDEAVDVEGLDIDANVKILHNLVSVDSEKIPNLDKPATITLYVGYEREPLVLQDGKICGECEVLTYDDKHVTFTVPHFTEYTTVQCPTIVDDYVIPPNTKVILCQDFLNMVDSAGDGIIKLGGNNIIIDCDGFAISGTGIGVYGDGSTTLQEIKDLISGNLPSLANIEDYMENDVTYIENITISNCALSGFDFGIQLESAQNVSVNSVEFYGNTEGMSLLGRNMTIRDIYAHDNNIGMTVAGVDVSVERVKAENNADTGVIAGGVRTDISNINATANKNGIITIGYYSRIFSNNASGNTQHGIGVIWSNGTEIFGNIADSNKNGIGLAEIADVKVYDNIANYNNKDGIVLGGFFSGGYTSLINISNNTAMYNTRAGIVLSDGTIPKVIELVMAKKSSKGHHIIDSYVEDNNLYNIGDAYDFGIIDGTGSHVYDNIIVRNIFKGRGVYDNYEGNTYCVDGIGNSYITALPVPGDCPNQPPTISGLPDQVFLQRSGFHDNIMDLWAYAIDAEDAAADMTYSIISQDTGVITCSIDSNRYIDCDNPDWATGISDVTVQVMDQGDLTGSDTFAVEVVINTPPVFDYYEIYVSEEGAVLDGQIFAHDDDVEPYGDYIIYTVDSGTLPVELKVDELGHIYTDDTFDYTMVGEYTVSMYVTDSTDATHGGEFTIEILNIPPIITNVYFDQDPPQEGQVLTGGIQREDPGPTTCSLVSSTLSQIRVTELGSIYSCNAEPCELSSPDPLPTETVGPHSLEVECSDPYESTTAIKEFVVNGIPTTPNSLCDGSPCGPNFEVSENFFPLEFTLSSTDPNPGDTITYQSSALPSRATLDINTGLFSWSPDCTQGGQLYTIGFKAKDNHNSLSGLYTVWITVIDVC